MEPTRAPAPTRELEILVEYQPRTPIRSRALRPPGAQLTEPDILADYLPTVLAAGPGAVLSHRSAGAIQGLRRYSGRSEVTVAADRRSRRDILYHQATLPQDEITHVDGIPCTSAARTVFDLAAILTLNQLKVVLHEADCNDNLLGTVTIADLLSRYPGRRGTRTARELLARYALNRDVLRNDFEADFQDFREAIGLPPCRTPTGSSTAIAAATGSS